MSGLIAGFIITVYCGLSKAVIEYCFSYNATPSFVGKSNVGWKSFNRHQFKALLKR